MSGNIKLIAKSIVKFLRKEVSLGTYDEGTSESLDIAVQCIESAFGVTNTPQDNTIPNLDDIFRRLPSTSERVDNLSKVADDHKNRGNALMQLGKYGEALEEYNLAIDMHDKNPVYYCNRAAAYSKLEKHNLAVIDTQRAISLDPTYSKAYGRLGFAYSCIKLHQEAKEAYTKALELDPDNNSYRNNLAVTEDILMKGLASTHSTTASTNSVPSETLFQDNMQQIFANPLVVNIATQFLGNPEMRNLMQGVLQTNVLDNNNLSEFFNQRGHQLIEQLQSSNPDILDQLRNALGGEVYGPQNLPEHPGGDGGLSPPQDPDTNTP